MAAIAVTEMNSQLHAAGGIVDSIKKALLGTAYNFCEIGYWLWYIREYKLYQEDGFLNIYDFSRNVLNISRGNVSKLINICVRFSARTVNLTPGQTLKKEYSYYSVSQLAEMLYLSDKKLEQVTPDMTIKEIRDIKEQEEEPESEEEEYESEPEPEDDIEELHYYFKPEDDMIIKKLFDRTCKLVELAQKDTGSRAYKEESVKLRLYGRNLAKKVLVENSKYKCPTCCSNIFNGDKYCHECGQRIAAFTSQKTI